MSLNRPVRPGADIDAYCTRCKRDFTHTVLSLASETTAERVRCNTCGSEHRFLAPRAGAPPVTENRGEREVPARAPAGPAPVGEAGLVAALRALLEGAGALSPTPIATRWEGGTIVLRPGRPGLQEKEVPIDALFRKIVMVRDRLRVLEQQINAHEKLSDAEKLSLHQYITRCYGSLTTFNTLFDAREDWFVGEKKSGE
jgi:DNA-directed RNA polymerase subunit RPC12/RpoP